MLEDVNAVAKPKADQQRVYMRKGICILDGDLDGKYLTKREAECMALLVMGKSCAAAARTLHLSVRTVEYYVKVLRRKLNCVDKSALIEKLVSCTAFLNQLEQICTTKRATTAQSPKKSSKTSSKTSSK